MRLHGLAFGEPAGSTAPVKGTTAPMWLHLALVLVAGVYLPAPLTAWFRHVAGLLG
jgi:hydrogenase-4 component F